MESTKTTMSAVQHGDDDANEIYAPPAIEEDLPLEVMSLACSGFGPKQAGVCANLGS